MKTKIPVAVSAFITLLNIDVFSLLALVILGVIGVIKMFTLMAERGVY